MELISVKYEECYLECKKCFVGISYCYQYNFQEIKSYFLKGHPVPP